MLGQIPLPMLDLQLIGEFVHTSTLPADFYSVRALGTGPFLWGFLLVEGLSMLMTHGRAQVRGRVGERARLARAGVVVGLMLAAVQGYAFATALLQMQVGWQSVVLVEDTQLFVGVAVATLVAVSAIVVMLSRWIDRAGLVHGFTLLVFLDVLPSLPDVLGLLNGTSEALLSLGALLFAAVVVHALVRPPLLVWGLAPLVAAAVSTWQNTRPLGDSGVAMGLGAVVVCAAVVASASRPASRMAGLGAPGPERFEKRRAHRARVVRTSVLAMLAAGALLVAVGNELQVPTSTWLWVGVVGPALLIDLVQSVRHHRVDDPWVLVWPLHQVYLVGPAQKALEKAEIPFLLRGLHYRTLMGPFDPRVPIEVMVPTSERARAEELLAAGLRVEVPGVIEEPSVGAAPAAGAPHELREEQEQDPWVPPSAPPG